VPTPGPAIHANIHYVPPERIRMEPHDLLTACGTWSRGTDWSTNLRVVSCARCLTLCVRRDVVGVEHAPAPTLG
jgi:hypothetical protein